MRILITGATGFIGLKLAHRMADLGHEIVGLDVLPPGSTAFPGRCILGDVRDRSAVVRAIDGCDAVFHLAAAHHDHGIDEATYYSVNVDGSQIICDAMTAAGVNKACFFSSVAVYGDAPEPRREDGPTAPNSHYGKSKLAAELRFREWCAGRTGRRVLVIRPTITFGTMNFGNMYALIKQIEARRYLSVGTGSNAKSLCFVENLLDATLDRWNAAPVRPLECFNYVDKPDLTSAQIANTIAHALGRPDIRGRIPLGAALLLAVPFDIVSRLTGRTLPISRARIRKFALERTVFSADKILETGFRPKSGLPEALTQMVGWFEASGKNVTPVRRHAPGKIVSQAT